MCSRTKSISPITERNQINGHNAAGDLKNLVDKPNYQEHCLAAQQFPIDWKRFSKDGLSLVIDSRMILGCTITGHLV